MFLVYLFNHTKVKDLLFGINKTNKYFSADEEQINSDYNNYQRTKNNNNNNTDYHQQRRHDYNNGYRQSPSQHQGQSSPFNNYHERTFFNRGRNGAFEQMILIRSNCVARIVGKLDLFIFLFFFVNLFFLRYTRF
jgi:hypothetical protein